MDDVFEICEISYVLVQWSCFSGQKQWATLDISDVYLDPECTKCQNVEFRQFFESVIRPVYLSVVMKYHKTSCSGHGIVIINIGQPVAHFRKRSEAFDCLPHDFWFAELNAYALTPTTCRLLGNYLSRYRQRVKVSNARNSWENLTKGVPHVSILGSLPLNISINDMFYFIDKCTLYNDADENFLSISVPTIEELLSNLKHDCDTSLRWYRQNDCVDANPNKFQSVTSSHYSVGNTKLKIDENITIAPETFVKFLDIYLINRNTIHNNSLATEHNETRRVIWHFGLVRTGIDPGTPRTMHDGCNRLAPILICHLADYATGPWWMETIRVLDTVKPVYNDHLMGYFSAFCSSSRWPRAT